MDMNKSFEQLITAVFELSHELFIYDSKPKYYGVDFPLYMKEIYILSLIGDMETTTAKELLKKTKTTKPAVSQTIKKLYEKGLISKSKSLSDFREVCLQLTPLGLSVYNYNKENDRKIYDIYLERLPEMTGEEMSRITLLVESMISIHKDLVSQNLDIDKSKKKL